PSRESHELGAGWRRLLALQQCGDREPEEGETEYRETRNEPAHLRYPAVPPRLLQHGDDADRRGAESRHLPSLALAQGERLRAIRANSRDSICPHGITSLLERVTR